MQLEDSQLKDSPEIVSHLSRHCLAVLSKRQRNRG